MLEYDVDEITKDPNAPFIDSGSGLTFYYDVEGYLCCELEPEVLVKYKPDDVIIKMPSPWYAPFPENVQDLNSSFREYGPKECTSFSIECDVGDEVRHNFVRFIIHKINDHHKMYSDWDDDWYFEYKDGKYSFFYKDKLYVDDGKGLDDVFFSLSINDELDLEFQQNLLLIFKDFIKKYN